MTMIDNPFLLKNPQLGEGVYISPGAVVIGAVKLGNHSSVWFNSVARGDVNEIIVGENTNIQDLSMLHVTEENGLYIGKNVTVGHNVTLHACTVADHCLIGMGAVVLDGSSIGENSLVAAGSVVPPNKKFPGGVLIRGNPGVVIRDLRPEELDQYGNHYKSYVNYKNQYLELAQKGH